MSSILRRLFSTPEPVDYESQILKKVRSSGFKDDRIGQKIIGLAAKALNPDGKEPPSMEAIHDHIIKHWKHDREDGYWALAQRMSIGKFDQYADSHFYKKDHKNQIFIRVHVVQALEKAGINPSAAIIDTIMFNAENDFHEDFPEARKELEPPTLWARKINYLITHLDRYVRQAKPIVFIPEDHYTMSHCARDGASLIFIETTLIPRLKDEEIQPTKTAVSLIFGRAQRDFDPGPKEASDHNAMLHFIDKNLDRYIEELRPRPVPIAPLRAGHLDAPEVAAALAGPDPQAEVAKSSSAAASASATADPVK